jgi:transposase
MSEQGRLDVRVRVPDRTQMEMRVECDDDLIGAGHQARVIWDVLGTLDLSAFYQPIRAREGVAGRDATDPRLLIALLLYGATRGVGSARELARLCQESRPYRWMCGGVGVNYHTLADFRVGHAAALDELFTQVIVALAEKGLIKVHRISQDGTRTRACAGAASFRGEERLAKLLAEAQAHVAELGAMLDDPEKSAGLSARQRAARRRAAEDRQRRLEQAIATLPEIKAKQEQAKKRAGDGDYGKKLKKNQPRVSTTDPEARVMKMGDGGFRPAVNVQLAGDVQSRAVVGVEVSNVGSDKGLAEPMRQQVERRTGCKVGEHLVDGGFLVMDEIDRAAADGVAVFAPAPKPRDPAKAGTEYDPKPTDSPAQADWRRRMGSDEGKAVYRQRAATIETVNADLKAHRGLVQLTVRGLAKASLSAWRCGARWRTT